MIHHPLMCSITVCLLVLFSSEVSEQEDHAHEERRQEAQEKCKKDEQIELPTEAE